jgi:thiol-disulfide isomerase/thioredoxin
MSEKSFHKRFTTSLALRPFVLSLSLMLLALVAPRLGAQDVPELPLPDGSGDTPEMIVKLVPSNVGPVVNQPKSLKLSSLRGKVVLLDLFWSKCSHCEEHAPHIVEFYNQYKNRGLTIVGLATDPESELASVRQFMAKAKISYPVGFLTTIVRAYYGDSHDSGVPQMVLFGPDGKMVIRRIGWNEKVGTEMKQAIEEQLSKMPASAPTVKPGSKATAKPVAGKTKQG